jgi:arylsulfatase A-like enzyme
MNKHNLIFVVMDSLRQDHVSFYNKGREVFRGVPPAFTPNIDRLAKESVVFRDAYPSGLPTVPQRTELVTGQFTLPYRPWAPLTQWDRTAGEILRAKGYVTGLITDTYHFFRPDYNFHRGMDSFMWIRGNEYDPYNVPPPKRRKVEDYTNEAMRKKGWDKLVEKYLSNVDDFEREEDWFAARVFTEASKWIVKNREHDGHIFLWVDSFDPHEPWFPPEQYMVKYLDPMVKPKLIMPMGGNAKDWATEEEQEQIRRLYAAEVTYVDRWFGHFLDTLRDTGVLDNSLLFLLADHGHPLGDHGKFLKGTDRMYNELLKIPFMVRLPGGEKARETKAMVTIPDVLPTVLEFLGFKEDTTTMAGKSFMDVLLGGEEKHRSYVVSGYHEGVDRCVRDGRYSLILRPEGQPDELYDLTQDPKETRNLVDERPEEAKRLASYLGIFQNTRYRSVLGGRVQGKGSIVIKGVQGRYEVSY